MPFAAAISEHPLATHAVGEVVGEVLDRLGPAPDVAVLFVGAAHTGAIEDISRAVRSLLQPHVLVGCTAGTVVGTGREVEDEPALSLWAARVGVAVPVRLVARPGVDGLSISGFPDPHLLPSDAEAVVVLADPFSFPTDAFLEGVREQIAVDLPVVGGLASAGRGPGGNRLVLDGAVHVDGAVAVVVGGAGVETVVSQGCRPVGAPFVVTKGERGVIHELAGRPALERVREVLASLDDEERALVQQGLHIGRVIDERKVDYGRGDFLIRNVLGADRSNGAVAVGDEVTVGDTVQLQVRDAVSADDDLRALLAGRDADAALLFTCNGRGTHLFGVPHHDASVLADATDDAPTAGMSCNGELGPVGGRSFLHGFTASIVLFKDGGRPPAAG